MAIFIGIEGVNMRRSFAVAADETGKIVGAVREKFGMSLHTIPRDVLQSRLRRLIQEVAHSAGRDLNHLEDAVICIGMTGVTFAYDAEIDLPKEFAELNLTIKKLICTGDAEIVFVSHVQTNFGAEILCHMGSTAYITKGPETKDRFRVGGWGPALGDEGSGFWLGRVALRAIGEEYEKKDPGSFLWNSISDWLSNPDPEVASWSQARTKWNRILNDYVQNKYDDPRPAIFTFAHEIQRENPAAWREVASGLAQVIIQSAMRDKDKSSEDIAQQAICHLTEQFLQASEISKTYDDSLPFVLYGGVLTHNPEFRQKLIESIQAKHPGTLTVIVPGSPDTMRPVCGALLFALANADTGNLILPKSSVIDQVKSDPAVTKTNGQLVND